ncbi:MAG: hypothetical protein ABSD46_04480 [Bacteroidota bacterium]
MADSTLATKDVENWIRTEFLPKKYHQVFSKQKLGVQSGGEFECDAVSEDGKIVCFISTSSSKTAGDKPGADELAKVRSNAFWAGSLSEKPQEIVFAFTDKSMMELIKKEKNNGRFPKHIKTLLVALPADLATKLAEMKKAAAEG